MFIVLSHDISHILLNRPNARILVRILHLPMQSVGIFISNKTKTVH